MKIIPKKITGQLIKDCLFPLIILLLVLGGYLHYKLNLSSLVSFKLQQELNKYIGTIFIVCIAFIIQRIVASILNWYMHNVASKTKTELDDKLIPLIRRSIKVVIWAIALLVILPLYGINITALVAALGVSSLAIALAAQDTIANIIAGFLLMVDAPFKIGDRIKLPSGELVEVLDIELRRSKFISEDKKAIVIVPNVDLSKSKIINYTYAEHQQRSDKAE